MTMQNDKLLGMNPITEDDIAQYLVNTPDFFERHAQLLGAIQLSSPHSHRAISLQERQAEMLREKIRTLEHRIMDMIRHGNDNAMIANKLHRWSLTIFDQGAPQTQVSRLCAGLESFFMVPQTALKLWDVQASMACFDFATGASDDVKFFASSLSTPYCGANTGFEAVSWLPQAEQVQSLAMIALRKDFSQTTSPAFGLLVLASPDPMRFHSGIGTDYLERIAELSSAALQGLVA